MPGNKNTRQRQLPGPLFRFGKVTTFDSGGSIPINYAPVSVPGKQVTVSEGHEWPPPKGSSLTDRGGDFFTTRSYLASPRKPAYSVIKGSGPGYTTTFRGTLVPNLSQLFDPALVSTLYPPSGHLSDALLDSWGTKAIALCKPGDPRMSLSTSLGELMKDGLPAILGQSIWQAKTLLGLKKASGGEYLNYQFGYKPMVDDILKFGDTITRSEQLLAQYERDAGRVVRRQFSFPIERSSVETLYDYNVWPVYINGIPGYGEAGTSNSLYGKIMKRRDTLQRVWFSGAFTYHLPAGYHSRNKVSELATKANALLGIELTPETLWNLAPWSWAADWFSNTGDVLSNVSSFLTHGLVMRYGYVMCQTIITDTYTHVSEKSSISLPCVSELVFVTETKQRRAANPFGFGLTWSGLSSGQIAIATALGINRK